MDNKLVFRINVQSVSDIITNSSSETFMISNANIPKEILLEELKTVNKSFHRWYEVYDNYQEYNKLPEEEKSKYENCSGDGGTIEVWDWKSEMELWIEYSIAKNKKDLVTPEIWALTREESLEELKKCLWVRIDNGFKNTLNHFLRNYEVYEENCDNYFLGRKDPNTGRILEKVSYDNYKKLNKNERAFAEWWGDCEDTD